MGEGLPATENSGSRVAPAQFGVIELLTGMKLYFIFGRL